MVRSLKLVLSWCCLNFLCIWDGMNKVMVSFGMVCMFKMVVFVVK